ncbi:CRISPR-associated helicase/endonuclease Cas3 [Campylobacterota bacterium]|nr:CRISPR-associated helicase/endonuclease Cas3 [Campylobacterota bacterium]
MFGAELLTYVAGLLHDFGKYTQEFQDYLRKSIRGEKVHRGEVIHSRQGAKFVLEMINEPLVAEIIANVIAAHHGGLYDGVSDGTKPIVEKTSDANLLHYLEAKIAFLQENENLLHKDLSELCIQEVLFVYKVCKEKKLNTVFMLHLFTKAIYSCLIDADRCDSAGLDIDSEINRATPNWLEYATKLDSHIEKFETDKKIDKVRETISKQCAKAGERDLGIYTLSVPTGSGKTLSSLRFALKHAAQHNKERIIYVIPYLSILDQTANNIRKALAYSENDDYILEHHSNIDIPEKENSAETEEDEAEYKLLTSRWDSPIILTTMVQFLETIYSNKASNLRKFHNMANSVIVFDEVQALPIKCIHLFNSAVNFLHIFGKSTILLCTATQPHFDKTERPILLSKNPALVSLTNDERKCFERVSVIDSTTKEGYDYDEFAAFTKDKLDLGKSTLVIVNTKTDAKELFKRCKDFDCDKAFLTTDLCPAHRLRVLKCLHRKLKDKRLTLCISTQLIEAGVDISFNCVIRAMAGLDSIVQAAGRCNRNGEDPSGQEVYVVNIKNEQLSKLPEIKDGQEMTRRVFDEKKGTNFLGDDALDLFYRYYFHDQEHKDNKKNEMDYAIKKDKTTIYNLLNVNKLELEKYESRHGIEYTPLKDGLPSAFKTAADEFSVIDQGQIGIVVPYNKRAIGLIARFTDGAKHDPKDKIRILKKLQRYTISVYSHTLERLLKDRAIVLIDNSFYLLNGDYYDKKEQGLLLDSQLLLKHF